MSCSEYVKGRGLKSLRFLSKESGVPESTLKNWYITKNKLFCLLVTGVVHSGE